MIKHSQTSERASCSAPRATTPSFAKKTADVSLRRRFFYGRRWITQAAHLKKPRRGFFPRRTVRRVDSVRIHPPSLREDYYKTETPVPGSDTGVLGGRGWTTQAAHLKKPRRGFFPRRTIRRVDAVRIHPHENPNLLQTENRQRISTLTVFLWARVDSNHRS